MKIQIMGGKITENLGFESPLQKVKNQRYTVFCEEFENEKKKKDKIFRPSKAEIRTPVFQ